MKNLILCCLASISLIALAACSDSCQTASTTSTQQSASMQTDSKDMHPVHH